MPSYPFHRSKHHDEVQRTDSNIQDDGRIKITFSHDATEFFHKYRARLVPDGVPRDLDEDDTNFRRRLERYSLHSRKKDFQPVTDDFTGVPQMNIAILITGSRGDVQPFIALGQTLKAPPYNHRVRICTHPVFKDFVEENGLEFFSIGGDPAQLMAYMVKNPGVIPSIEEIKSGVIAKRKLDIAEMLEGSWMACTEPGDGLTNIDLAQHARDDDVLLTCPAPFVADAIIANPPSYAALHIAERLGVPLHMVFTMPWSPTTEFPHPLANLDAKKVDQHVANFLSYKKMELITWEGLSDLINHFREKTLFLDPISPLWGYRLFPRLKVPFTYCWSEALIPKPKDWGPHITISGFFFLPLASSYKPDPELQAFLDAGPPPVYIGFGSIVVDDPQGLTNMIFEAVRKARVRALVSKGWGGVGSTNVPENIHLLGNVPHDWLFPRCSAVVHHGGAGTTAIGVALGKPTVIVPFFGDQPWWAGMIYRAGAGPEAVPFKHLTADKLAENIKRALQPDILERAHELAEKIQGEDGTKKAAQDFHNTEQMRNLHCFLYPEKVAVWRIRRTNVQLSSLAAAVLATRGKIKAKHLKLVRHKRWCVEEGAQDPMQGLVGALANLGRGVWNDVFDFIEDMEKPRREEGGLKVKTVSSDTSSDDATDIHSGDIHYAKLEALKKYNYRRASCCKSNGQRLAVATGQFAESTAIRIFRAPTAILYNLTNGFHNAPAHLLGDPTVRMRGNITGIVTGLRVGGQELVLGTWDAFSGPVTRSMSGYREGKTRPHGPLVGLAKGVAGGLVSFPFKLGSAILGPIGYGSKGAEREVQRWWTGSDNLHRDEVELVKAAREEVKKLGDKEATTEERHASQMMWVHAKGAGVGKRMVERRVWQGYREVSELRAQGEAGAKIEQAILDRWDKLAIDEAFLQNLMS